MHSPQDKLLAWYVFDQVLCLDNVEHLTYLTFTKSVYEVDLIEVYQLCVLGGDGKRTCYLTLMRVHQALYHSIVLTRFDTAKRVKDLLLVGALLVVCFRSWHEVQSLDHNFLV